MSKIFLLLFFSIWSTTSIDNNVNNENYLSLNQDEKELYDLLMNYRLSKGLSIIPLSGSLNFVAKEHCEDLYYNKPDLKQGCNAHSWSGEGRWSSCCYTSDHSQTDCMWDKPKELTKYTDWGVEIAIGSSEKIYQNFIVTPIFAFESWKKSPAHNIVIINEEDFEDVKWNAIGVSIYKNFACVWFGPSLDDK